MPQVAVQINGKMYRMACDEGQEAHLLDLAGQFDQSITRLKESFGEMGDQRLTVMAGIMAHDKLTELQQKFDEMQSEITKYQEQGQIAFEHVEKITEQIINITGKLKQ